MTDQSIQQLLSRSLYQGGAQIITKRTLQELLRFNEKFDGSIQWRDEIVAISDTIYELGNGLSVVQVVIWAMIEDHWKEFSQEWRNMWDDDFLVFVYRRYGRKPNTVRADLRAVRIFLLDERAAAPFGTVEVPKRDQTGAIVKDEATGKCLTERIEWDVTKTSLPKLKVAVPLVEQGKMTPQTWGMLADDHISSSQMVKTIYEVTDGDPHPPQLNIRFRLQGPVLVAYQNGNEVELGELNWESYYEEPYSFKHRALDKLMELLGLTLDEHLSLYLESEKQANGYYREEI